MMHSLGCSQKGGLSDLATVAPRLAVLTPAQIEQVHECSLRVLSSAGVRVDAQRARTLFRRALGPAALQDGRLRLSRELVEWALGVAPSRVDVYDRHGDRAFTLPGEARFGIGVTALYYQDPETDQVAPFSRRHMQSMVRLGALLPSFDVISTVGIVQDVSPEQSDLVAALEMAANTTKPLVLLVSDEAAFPLVLDLLDQLCGGMAGRPFVIPYFNPITPLVINTGTVDKMWVAIERGLPFIYSNYGMAGASTPIAPAGALVLLNAELLAGLTLGQLIRQGAPMILGSLPAYFDMKGKGSFYAPQSYVIDLACAEMMAHYGLPHAGTSGAGIGWGADLLAAGHQWTNHLVSCMGKAGLVPFVGDNLASVAFSPALVVYADEVIQQARMLARGFSLDGITLALDEIAQVGPGGTFLMSSSTLKQFRTAGFRSPILPPLTLDDWQARGCPRADQVLREHTRRLLSELKAPQDHDELQARGEAFIRALPRHW
jgi:trimethylamine--corrinoid protein Co-methyltransferase